MLKKFLIFFTIAFLVACGSRKNSNPILREPNISPDYKNVVWPVNMAPANFSILEKGDDYFVEFKGNAIGHLQLKSGNGKVQIPIKKWKTLLSENQGSELNVTVYVKQKGRWNKFNSFLVEISPDSISPYIAYRKIDPGNIFWNKMGIYQRCLENFKETPIITNDLTDKGCMNCHSFAAYNPNQFQLHFRKNYSGTLICTNGVMDFVNTKTDKTYSNATYPAWHPSGKYIAYSINKIQQRFFAQTNHYEMVYDTISDIVLYNVAKNEFSTTPKLTTSWLENLPVWSPDGRFLYYISAPKFDLDKYKETQYSLLRIAFNPETEKWGRVDTILSAARIGKSFSFPSVSPNSRFILCCVADYGYFTIHHKESEIAMLDLGTLTLTYLPINSEMVESYPVWSANGRWIMFVSKRNDNTFSRPWFSHFSDQGEWSKPFVLSQNDPDFYESYLLNFNRPEFIAGKVNLTPAQIKAFITTNEPEPSSFKGAGYYDGASRASVVK